MDVRPYASIKTNMLLNISEIPCHLVNKLWKKQRSTLTVVRDTHILCRTFIRDPIALSTTFKQFIHLKWLFNILYHVSRSYLVISSQIKHWFFLYFENGDRHIFLPKKYRAWSERLRFILRLFLKLASFGWLTH